MPAEAAASVLIVEDERLVARDLQQILSALGYDAFAIAATAEEALARASERRPDVALMDIRIKGDQDGIEAATMLKERFGVPVIYLTAYGDRETVARAKVTEPLGFLIKPVRAAELRSAIEICLYRHGMERELRRREHWFAITLRSLADGVIAVDPDGRVSFLNPVAEGILGVTLTDARSGDARAILRLADREGRALGEPPLEAAMKERRVVAADPLVLTSRKDGRRRAIAASAAPVTDGDELLGAVMVLRDVTAARMLEKQLEAADRLASLGTIAAGVAHEISNPLTIVNANIAYVLGVLAVERMALAVNGNRPPAPPSWEGEVREALEESQAASGRIERILADMKVFSQPPQRQEEAGDVSVAVKWALRTTANQLRHRATLVSEIGELPRVRTDEVRLGQVLVNLLVNAGHAIGPGRAAENEIRVTGATDRRGWAVVEVRDTGSGIPADQLERIFEPFFTTKDPGQGTGLGLAISHGIVDAAGGRIEVESRVGEGTVMRVLLPPLAAEVVESEEDAGPASASPPRRARVLVIDDEPIILKVMRRVLAPAHEPICVASAREALAMLAAGEAFDAIVCDLRMPEMSGIEFYQALVRSHPELAPRVVFMTGGPGAEAEQFLASIPNRCLDKPGGLNELARVIGEVQGARER